MTRFGVSIYSITSKIQSGEWGAARAISWLAEQGAECVELVPFGLDFLGDPALIDECLAASAASGIPIENFSLNANFLGLTEGEYADEMARVKSYMEVCRKLGIRTLRVDCASFRRPIETNTTAHFTRELPLILGTYTALCAHAAPMGIKVLLENHGFHVNGSERTAQIFEAMKNVDNFGGQIDTGNYVCVDELADVAVRKNICYATTVHMKDFYIRPEDRDPGDAKLFDCSNSWFRSVAKRYLRGSILGQGDLNMPLIIKIIKRSGFDGNIFIEYEGMEDCLYGTKVSLDNLKRMWAEA